MLPHILKMRDVLFSSFKIHTGFMERMPKSFNDSQYHSPPFHKSMLVADR